MDKIDELINDFQRKAIYNTLFDATDEDAQSMKASRAALRAEYARLQQELVLTRGAMAADDERLRVAGKRVGIEHCDCDTAEWMADKILELQQEADRYHGKLVEVAVELENTKQELASIQEERDYYYQEYAILRELKEPMRWIPVTERLPEIIPSGNGVEWHIPVMCLHDGEVLAPVTYQTDDGLFGDWYDNGGTEVDNVTHWMPLPELPEVTHV